MEYANTIFGKTIALETAIDEIFSTPSDKDSYRKIIEAILLASKNINGESYRIFFDTLTSHKQYQKIFPTKVDRNQYYCGALSSNGAQSCQWTINNFVFRKKQINEFIKLNSSYERNYIVKNYKKCIKILNNIDGIFGLSLWSALERIKCQHQSLPPDEFEKYCKEYKNGLNDKFIRQMIEYLLVRLESSVLESILLHIKSVLEDIRSTNNEWPATLISIYMIPIEHDDKRMQCQYPLVFPGITLVDQYYIFKTCAIDHACTSTSLNFIDTNNLILLKDNIIDPTWQKLYELRTNCETCIYSENIKKILNMYSSGEYKSCIEAIENHLQINPTHTALVDVFVKSMHYAGVADYENQANDTIAHDICYILKNIVYINKDTTEQIEKLEALLSRHFPQSWTYPAYTILYCLFYHYNEDKRVASCKRVKLNHLEATPLIYASANKDVLCCCAIETKKIISQNDNDTSTSIRNIKSKLRNLLSESNIDKIQIEKHLEDLKKSKIKFRYEYYRIYVDYLMKIGDYSRALTVVVDRCVDNIEEFRCYQIDEILDKCKNQKDINNQLEYPILHHIYATKINKEHYKKRNIAYQIYVESFGSHHPSNIFVDKDTLCKKSLYFIQNICIPSIMDSSPFWTSNEELMAERIKLLNILIEKDKINTGRYINEKLQIFNETIVEQSRAEIDNCKIHVDIDALKRQRKLKYEMFYDLYRNAQDSGTDSESEFLILLEDDQYPIGIPKGDKNNILLRIIHAATDDFVHNNDYGLDKYLSSDIRHQVFLNLMRSCAIKNNLVTDRNDDTYAYNDFWTERYSLFGTEFTEQLNTCLEIFASNFDDKLIEANDWLKVTTNPRDDKHLFSYAFGSQHLEALGNALNNFSDFDSFFNCIIEFMWIRTEININQLKYKINENFRRDIIDTFNKLKSCISQYGYDLNELNGAIDNSIRSFIENIETVNSWLVKRSSGYLGSLDLLTLIEVSKRSFAALHQGQEYKFTESYSDNLNAVKVTEKEARALVRALTILYENAYRYGHYSKIKNIMLDVDLNEQIIIKISNKFDTTKYSDPEGYIEEINKTINDSSKSSLVRKEGNSGLYKINNFLTRASNKFKLHVQYDKPYFFSVYIIGGKHEDFNH